MTNPETIHPQPHILVVDDDPHIRELLQEYLAENGLRVSVALNGAQMSQTLVNEVIDLIILDLRLAGEDGMTLVRTLRDQSAGRSKPKRNCAPPSSSPDRRRSCHRSWSATMIPFKVKPELPRPAPVVSVAVPRCRANYA